MAVGGSGVHVFGHRHAHGAACFEIGWCLIVRASQVLAVLAAGALFGAGLAASGMVRPQQVLAFLRWQDFGLLLVLGAAVAVTMVAYQLLPRLLKTPLLGGSFEKRREMASVRSLGGAALFGVGWGLSGVCPGPAIAALGTTDLSLLWVVAAMAVGAWIQGRLLP